MFLRIRTSLYLHDGTFLPEAALFNHPDLVKRIYFVEREREREREILRGEVSRTQIVKTSQLNKVSNLFFQENFCIFPTGIVPAGNSLRPSLRAGTPQKNILAP
jgi:hypothetical protein